MVRFHGRYLRGDDAARTYRRRRRASGRERCSPATLARSYTAHGQLAGGSLAWYISSGDDAYPPGRLSMVRAWSELGHPLRSELVALAPPYRAHTSVSSLESGDSLPLGSVVLGKGDTTIAVLAERSEERRVGKECRGRWGAAR